MQNNDGDRPARTAAAAAFALFVLHAKYRIAGMEHEIISAIVWFLSFSLSLSLSLLLSIFAERMENPPSSRFFSLLAQTMEIVNISTRNEARVCRKSCRNQSNRELFQEISEGFIVSTSFQ